MAEILHGSTMNHITASTLWIIFTTVCFTQGQNPSAIKKPGIFQLEMFETKKTHAEAKEFCEGRNSWLAELKTTEIEDEIAKLGSGWIGGKYSSNHNSWEWGDGTTLVHQNWAHGNPTSRSTRNCIELRSGGLWFEEYCSSKRNFICQSAIQTVAFIGGKELYFYSDMRKNFRDAATECQNRNSHLVSILTDEMDNRITNELNWRLATRQFYTSGHYSNGEWVWKNLEAISDSDPNWASGEPNGISEDCLAKGKGGARWKWIDIGCNQLQSYICEKDVVGNRCSPDICSNNGACTVVASEFQCQCTSPFHGRKCEIDVCDPHPCNHGQCTFSTSHPYYTCTCGPEYDGSTCGERKFLQHGDCRYHINFYERGNHLRGEQTCHRFGSALAMLKTIKISNFIEEQIKIAYPGYSNTSFWAGGHRHNNAWEWMDGSVINSNKLKVGTGNCLALENTNWNPKRCEEASGFICERPVTTKVCDHCQNGGACNNIGCSYKCECPAGYDGKVCERDLITVTLGQSLITAKKGERTTITLNITSHVGQVKITFYKSGGLQSSQSSMGGLVSYDLEPFTSASSGTACYFDIQPARGGFSRRVDFDVIVLAPATIRRIDPKSIVVPRESYYNYYITCEATGQPQPTIRWYKGCRLVTEDSSTSTVYQYVGSTYAKLKAYYAIASDAGLYTCRANNTVGEEKTPATDEKHAYLRIKLKQTGSNAQSAERYFAEKAEFSCTFNAFPEPQVTWELIRNQISTNISSEDGSIFKITTETSKEGQAAQVTSVLRIVLADCLGHVSITCTGGNVFESSSSTFILNQRVRMWKNSNFIFSKSSDSTYDEAKKYCEAFNGTLASIPDEDTDTFLKKLSEELLGTSTYVGGRRISEGGSKLWKWPDGRIFYNESKHDSWTSAKSRIIDGIYVGWYDYRPTTYNDRDCLYLGSSKHYEWSNSYCSTRLGSICEKSMVGKPVILSTAAENCSATIHVSWRPGTRGIGIKHRVELEPTIVDGAIKPEAIDVIAQDRVHLNDFHNLTYSTTYLIKIYVCPDYCMDMCHSVHKVSTAASIPQRVAQTNVTQQGGSTCRILWSPAFGVTFYQITASAKLEYFSSEAMRNRTLIEVYKTSAQTFAYIHTGLPNREYTFRIRAGNCAGLGKARKAIGSCKTERAAPSFIPPPKMSSKIIEDGTANITLPTIDDRNGPISCIFVIAIKDPNADSNQNQEYGQAEIEKVNDKTLKRSTDLEYVTLAISKEELLGRENTDGEVIVKIGDNSTSKCDVDKVISTQRSKRAADNSKVISGWNAPLSNDNKYGFYTVTSTPGEGGKILYKRSEISILGDDESQSSGQGWIAAVVICLFGVIALIVITIFFLRRKQAVATPSNNRPIPLTTVTQTQEPVYANLSNESKELRSDTDIPLERLESIYNSMKANDHKGFQEEYQKLKIEAKHISLPTEVASRASLKKKNRYKNILPYDKTRVKLKGSETYINASYIEGLSQPHKFIATQGPLPSTVNDFWRMIVEQKCGIIVMLTKCFEKGKKKCEKYWPEIGESEQYGNITVQNQIEAAIGCFVKRTLRVVDETQSEGIVYQFQLLKWPDHGVPMTTSSFFRFQNAVSDCRQETGTNAPMIVHCSAGAGRSGAFIAYDYLSEERQNLDRVDILTCVLKMRKQRVDMVQNCDQYMFVYKLLLEAYLFGSTEMRPDQVASVLSNAEEERISEEFNNLSVIDPIQTKLHGAHQELMNRKRNIVPYEQNHVIIVRMRDEIDTPYVNASIIESYDSTYTMIAAQGPLEVSIENFWRAIFDNDVTVIIMLTKCIDGHKEQCAQYWPTEVGDSFSTNNISAEVNLQRLEDDIVIREIHVTKENQSKTVVQYQYKSWSSSTCPNDPATVLKLVNKMQAEIRARNEPTVLIHCSDGAGRTGAFCAIVNLIERLNVENNVDVFREVKDLRDCRPGMVQTLEQYRFCYQAISEYFSASNVYSNFNIEGEEKVYENL